MKYLQELMLEHAVNEQADKLTTIGDSLITLNEGVTDLSITDLPQMYDEAIKRLAAAKQGMGLANQLKDPAEKKKHRSRILGNLNRLRALVNRLADATAEMVSGSVENNLQRQTMNNVNNVV